MTVLPTLVHLSDGLLPSQEGQRGRPRKNGRVSVHGRDLDRKQIQAALAARYGIEDPNKVAIYPRESDAFRLTFVVPGVPRDARETLCAVCVPRPVVEACEAPEEAALLAVA